MATKKSAVLAARAVAADREMAEGIFIIGQKYEAITPTYRYKGILVAVTETVFVFEAHSTVYETGPMEKYYSGESKIEEAHTGSGRLILDRGGCHLCEFLK
jgi:hypothetical protein